MWFHIEYLIINRTCCFLFARPWTKACQIMDASFQKMCNGKQEFLEFMLEMLLFLERKAHAGGRGGAVRQAWEPPIECQFRFGEQFKLDPNATRWELFAENRELRFDYTCACELHVSSRRGAPKTLQITPQKKRISGTVRSPKTRKTKET